MSEVTATEPEIADDEFLVIDALEIQERTLPKMAWHISGVIPKGKVGSIAGASNVAKTYYVTALAVALSLGRTERLGFPTCEPTGCLIIGNEEDLEDLQYRVKAPSLYYNEDKAKAKPIVLRGCEAGNLIVASKNDTQTMEIDKKAVSKLIEVIRQHDIGVVFLDPYVTISLGMEENSNDGHPIVMMALKMVTAATGVTVIHVHHTKKGDGRSKNYDSYNGDRDAWRGAGVIYSGLDFGLTLGNWMPPATARHERAAWIAHWNSSDLGRFVTVMCGKPKRSKRFPPIIYEMIDMPMQEETENPLPVFQISSVEAAMAVLTQATGDDMLPFIIAQSLVDTFSVGTVKGLPNIHSKMRGQPGWPNTDKVQATQGDMKKIIKMFDLRAAERKWSTEGAEFSGSGRSKSPPACSLRSLLRDGRLEDVHRGPLPQDQACLSP